MRAIFFKHKVCSDADPSSRLPLLHTEAVQRSCSDSDLLEKSSKVYRYPKIEIQTAMSARTKEIMAPATKTTREAFDENLRFWARVFRTQKSSRTAGTIESSALPTKKRTFLDVHAPPTAKPVHQNFLEGVHAPKTEKLANQSAGAEPSLQAPVK